MRQVLAVSGLVLTLACQPATGGIKEADEVGESSSESSSSQGSEDICDVGSLGCACTPGGGCDPGLVCEGDMCSEPGGSSESDPTTSESSESTSETGACTQEGCACEDVDGACDLGLECIDGTCTADPCGNAALDFGEQCDDGNEVDGDGCDADCSFTEVLQLAAGDRHTCALLEGGAVRCWGEGDFGQLGYGNTSDIGDTETPASAGDVPLPARALALEAGEAHTCGLFEDDALRCWGKNWNGQLGYANTAAVQLIGDDESLDTLAAIMLGDTPTQFSMGSQFGCARFADGEVRCWGANGRGQLGLGNTNIIGDDEHPNTSPMMFLGAQAASVAAGGEHACAVTSMGFVRCWGFADRGQLGYGSNQEVGDNEPPSDAGDLILVPGSLPDGTDATALALGKDHSCVLFSTGDVLCWGKNDKGQLGQANTSDWGDQGGETPSTLMPIDLGANATAIAAGTEHACAILEGGTLMCWGRNEQGQLGLGNIMNVGDDETPASAGTIDVGGTVTAVVAGAEHTCALRSDFGVVCWGKNTDGRLGYGHVQTIGDNELPASAGTVELW